MCAMSWSINVIMIAPVMFWLDGRRPVLLLRLMNTVEQF
jgi:hypothetical protein